METKQGTDLLSFHEIKEGKLFFGYLMLFKKTLLQNLKESGVKAIEPENVILRPNHSNSDFHTFFIPTIGTPKNKKLAIGVNNTGNVEFGVFIYEEDTESWKEIIKSEFMTMYDFNDLFTEIIRNLK